MMMCGSLRWSVLGCAGALMQNSRAKKICRKYWNCMCCYMVKQNKKKCFTLWIIFITDWLKERNKKKQLFEILKGPIWSSKKSVKYCSPLKVFSDQREAQHQGQTGRVLGLLLQPRLLCVFVRGRVLLHVCVCVCGGYWSRLCSLPGASWSSAKARAL